LEDLQVDASTFGRMTCCGKAMHNHCAERFFGSSMSQEQKSKCPQCQVKLASTEESVERARGWADKGKAWARADMGTRYRFGQGVEQSYEKSIEYFTLAIQENDPNAMYGLACMYVHGQGVAKSFERAVELFALAANQGHATAQYNSGVAYANGKSVAQSDEKAFELLTLAANQGYAKAQFNLGNLYIHGQGVAQSNDKARKWWLKAALQEDEDAIEYLKILDQQESSSAARKYLFQALLVIFVVTVAVSLFDRSRVLSVDDL
jgi:TPR repeat protein